VEKKKNLTARNLGDGEKYDEFAWETPAIAGLFSARRKEPRLKEKGNTRKSRLIRNPSNTNFFMPPENLSWKCAREEKRLGYLPTSTTLRTRKTERKKLEKETNPLKGPRH